jgi:hypothetical protein
MALLRDIPDDNPENTVKNILLIIEEEADRLKAKVDSEIRQQAVAVAVTVDVSLRDKRFQFFVSYFESCNLHAAKGSIGIGFISFEDQRWKLELLPKDILAAPEPPFRWGLYPLDHSPLDKSPTHILDGTLLRRLLTDALSPQPPS